MPEPTGKTAVWAVTDTGCRLATALCDAIPRADLFLKAGLGEERRTVNRFDRLARAVDHHFSTYDAHIFFMATGIVVRLIARHLVHKTSDPAVVVVDDTGRHAISLVSGHVGGANRLATAVAEILGARPVITTATDNQGLPAIDLIAVERGLAIENPEAIRHVSMALLQSRQVAVQDPHGFLPQPFVQNFGRETLAADPHSAGVLVDDRLQTATGDRTLILRPPTLAVGIGCNRGTPGKEMQQLLHRVFDEHRLSVKSIWRLASIDIKADEQGLNHLAASLDLPIRHFTREELNDTAGIHSESPAAKKHLGVKSVCEAAAILAAENGTLVVPKQKSRNVTLAVARRPFSSSA
jgi:cobalt-precorrin 5A hydrolase